MTGLREKLSQQVGRLLPSHIPLLYLVLSVLLALSVIPLLIYSTQVSSRNRKALQTNEQELQTAVTRGIAQEIRLYIRSMDLEIRSLARSLRTTGAIENVAEERHADSLREATEEFVREAENILFLTIVNQEQRGIAGGDPTVGQDDFVKGELGEAFQKAQLGTAYNSKAFLAQQARGTVPVMVMARPLSVGNDFRGMVATVVSLDFLRRRLEEASKGGLVTYVVDGQGQLVVHPDLKNFNVGRDMSHVRSVQMFRERVRGTTTQPFELDGQQVLGTQSPVPELDWAVIAQKTLADAYITVRDMERYAVGLAFVTILVSMLIGYRAARALTTPLQVLTETTRAIAKGDFSRRVNLPSRTEIGELATTFNIMTDDLEKYVEQLKQAAQENHDLFLGSIRTLSTAIDEKDPYTRGHSGRVSKYSVILAEAMGLEEEQIYKIRISALLHDVGKIGVDDRVLKKPAGLTPEEFELMRQHPVKGANIIRPVSKLREMIPGIELHHESLDGHGYPYGLKGEEIPLMARIIAVADTLDAMTTNRPYQVAMGQDTALDRIRSLQVKRFDPDVVDALFASVESGHLKVSPAMVEV